MCTLTRTDFDNIIINVNIKDGCKKTKRRIANLRKLTCRAEKIATKM